MRFLDILPLAILVLPVALGACPPRHDYGDGRGLAGQLEREVIALQQKNRLLEHRAATCDEGGPPDALYSDLAQIFTGSDHALHRQANASVLTVPNNYLFADDRMEVRLEATKTLDLLGMVLNSHPDYTVVIEAHVAERQVPSHFRGDHTDQWELSFAYANLLREALVQRYRVSEYRFTVAARGSYKNLTNNDTDASKRVNNRIVLYIYPPGAR